MPGVLTVSGVDRNGAASFDASSQGITIGVAAPSEQLVGVIPGGGYVTWSGTSGATPIVAGIVALVRAAHPDLDAANVINRIDRRRRATSATDGADFTYGYGLVDAEAAVEDDVPLVDENPVGDLAEWIRVNRRADATPTPGAVDAAGDGSGGRGGPREPDRNPAAVGHHAAAGRHPGLVVVLLVARCWWRWAWPRSRQFRSGRRAR